MDYGFIGGDKELLIKQVICSLLIYMIIAVIDIIKEKKRVDISANIQYSLSEQSFKHLMKIKANYCGIIGLFILDYRMTLMVLFFIPVKAVIIKHFAKKRKRIMDEFMALEEENGNEEDRIEPCFGDLELQNLSFSYEKDKAVQIFRNLY